MLKIGDLDVNKIYLGDIELKKMYLGDVIVFEPKDIDTPTGISVSTIKTPMIPTDINLGFEE